MKIDNSVSAVVTGGASGLGEACVRALAGLGVKVAIFDMNELRGSALAAEVNGTFCKVDITSDVAVDAGFARARAAHGQERILINCAGTGNAIKTASRSKTGEISHFPLDAFEMVVRVNLIGTFRCIAKAAAGMLTLDPLGDGERGCIVNTGSVAAQDGQIGQVAYAASKAGIVGLTLPVARDLSSEGVRINTILPGLFGTPPMLGLPEQMLTTLATQVPFPKRLGYPAEFASMVTEICRNTYMNGETIRLDGAIRMAPK
jgi:NAD(P)-dependent dehydrogenase (short-subunit alcohol dehydrogenase family)